MKNKKGFTLVEVLAVIALIGALLLLVVPTISTSFKKAQKNLFYDNLLSLYGSATTTYLYNASEGDTTKTFCHNGDHKLGVDLNEEVQYTITVDGFGQVVEMHVTDTRFKFEITKQNMQKSDIDKDAIEDGALEIDCSAGTISYNSSCVYNSSVSECKVYNFNYTLKNKTA